MIELETAANGQQFEGHRWAIRPLPDWAELLGISVDAITDLIKVAPIRKTYTRVEGRKAVLLRVGDAAPPAPREIVNMMAGIFYRKYQRYPDNHDYGCLHGLAAIWPDGHQIGIFCAVINDLPAFMAGVKQIDPSPIYHKFLSLKVLRKHAAVAQHLYAMKAQAEGKMPFKATLDLYPADNCQNASNPML